MTHAPDELRKHLELMSYDAGAIELVAGTNNPANPDKIDLVVYTIATFGQGYHTREFVDSADLARLERRAAKLTDRWGNVYIGVGTVGKLPNSHKGGRFQYNRRAVQPRRCVVADDVTDLGALRLRPTWATETSSGNFQCGWVCDELLSPAESEAIARGIAAIEQTDPSGADATQIIRLAGTLNTKAKCAGSPGDPDKGIEPEGWRVRLRVADGPRYSKAALFAAYAPYNAPGARAASDTPERRQHNGAGPGIGDSAWCAAVKEAADWRGYLWRDDGSLDKGGLLLRDDGTPRILKADHILCRVIKRELSWSDAAAQWGHKDASGSGYTYHLAGALWRAGAPLAQLIATVEALDPDARRKGDAWFYHQSLWGSLYGQSGWTVIAPDIARRPLQNFTPRSMPAPVALERPKRGRPVGARDAGLERCANLLNVGATISRADLAAALGTTVRTVGNYLAELRDSGRLVTETAGRALRVVSITPATVENKFPPGTDAESAPAEGSAAPPHADTQAGKGKINTGGTEGNYGRFSASQSGVTLQEDHTPPFLLSVPAAPAPRRRLRVREVCGTVENRQRWRDEFYAYWHEIDPPPQPAPVEDAPVALPLPLGDDATTTPAMMPSDPYHAGYVAGLIERLQALNAPPVAQRAAA